MEPKSYVFVCTPMAYREGLRDLAECAIQPKILPVGTTVYIRDFENWTMWWKLEKKSIGSPPDVPAGITMTAIKDEDMDDIIDTSELVNFKKLIIAAMRGWLMEGLTGIPSIDN